MSVDATCSCDSRKKDKSTLLSLQPYHFMKTMKKKKKKTCGWLVKELALQQRTELQAALVCTITKRCSLGNHATPNKQTMKTQQ